MPAFWSHVDTSQSAASATGQRAADHEAEVTRRIAGHRAARRLRCEQVDDGLVGASPVGGQRRAQCGQQFLARGARADVRVGQGVEVVEGVRVGAGEQASCRVGTA